MTLDEIDRALAGFRQAIDSMTANLFELENDSTRQVLQQASLTGATADQWALASRALGQLWQWFTQFQDVVERTTALRGTKARLGPQPLADLSELVGGPSIELSAEQIPLSRRALLGPAETTVRCRPDELLAQMSEAFDQAKAVVSAAGAAWTNLLPRLQQAETAVAGMETLAGSLGEGNVPELAEVRHRLDALSGMLATDPLGIDPAAVDGAETMIAAVRQDLDELAQLRAGLTTRLDQARALLAQVEQVLADGRAAHDEVMVKIASAVTDPPLAPDPELAARLDAVTALAARVEWRAARHALAEWTTRATDLLTRAQQVVATNRAVMDERNELRGRLEGYRAKANRLGLAEDGGLAAQYEHAHEVLYTAPTDLTVAADLVRRYQQAIPSVPHPREVPS